MKKTFTKRFISLLSVLVLTVGLSVTAMAAVICPNCDESCTYDIEYEQWGEEYHTIRGWCSECGEDIYQGTNAGVHKMRNGECTLCGYSEICYHDYTDIDWYGCEWEEYCEDCGEVLDYGIEHGSTYTEWDDCDWYEYCRDCDELLDEGTEHGDYAYDDWEYYTSSKHRRYYYCEICGGDDGYDTEYHDTDIEYSSYDSEQHEVIEYCYDCDSEIDAYYDDHSLSYGSWTNYSGSQHRRSVYCYDCGYSSYEYAGHSLTYGSWTSAGSSQHQRTISCSCGYSTTETASHTLTYGSWSNYSASQHKRTISCSGCSYSGTEYADHSITAGDWTSISDTEHSRTGSCSCGYSGTETEEHSFSYGEWESYDDSEHRRTVSCDCGYSGYAYEDHEHITETGKVPLDESRHNILYACECGHTAEEPEDHTFSYGDWTESSAFGHSREVSCDCGYIGEEYDDHTDADSDGFCDICDAVTSRFSVTLPAVMTIVVSGDGEVYAADNAAIINNSTGRIIVSSVTVSAGDNWTLAPYDYNMANEKVDSRMIGFSLNELCTTSFGDSEILEPAWGWIVDTDTPYALDYDAVVSATSDVIQNEQVLTLVFVVEWLLL
ncbi:MAG: hypothetical protein IJF78_08995 [Clostridia bacterium]|nr:hypothetical protein [Clostridia bacterium]